MTQQSLFSSERVKKPLSPLSFRMRPRNLAEFVGQKQILGPGKLLRRSIEADRISSIILYGPPGVGKTALALIIAEKTKAAFERINAVTAGVAEIHKCLQKAKERKNLTGQKTILFIDEIHRFNKLQQDALLPDVESGLVTLIGTTVENPYFYITSPLLSRSNIFQFYPLKEEELETILKRALTDPERGFGKMKIKMTEEALRHLIQSANGDARRGLNALEIGVLTTPPENGEIKFTLKVAEESIQKKALLYDRAGDMHYDIISAFIKSMRGSDPDASLYWLAKMLVCGEDPRFIARRIVICAAEDVGCADPMALVLAEATLGVVEFIGMPEAKIPLAQAAIYIATAPKSNAAYEGITAALKEVKEGPPRPVPPHLRDAHYPGAKKLGHGLNYRYPHSFPDHFVPQEYMPLKKKFYHPTGLGFEKVIKERLAYWEKKIKETEK